MQYTPLRKYDLWSVARFAPLAAVAAAGATVAGSAVSAMGTIAGGNAAADAGIRAQQSYEFKAKQEQMAAQEARAVAQRQALEEDRKATLLLSTLQARGAADGGNAADVGILNLAGNIAGRGKYDGLFKLYQGENRARGLDDSATASRMTGEAAFAEGQAKKQASRLSALGTVIGGFGSAFSQFKGGPQ
jgi:hypothetical protein